MENNIKEYVRWKWLFGRPADLWRTHVDVIADFISANKLEPIGREHIQVKSPEKLVIDLNDLICPWGGKKFAHIHYNGGFYQLTETQWESFSNIIIAGFSEKLAQSKTIHFEQLVNLSDAMNRLGR